MVQVEKLTIAVLKHKHGKGQASKQATAFFTFLLLQRLSMFPKP